MRRIVVVSNGIAGAKAAARIKRLEPETEVNLVTTSSVAVDDEAKKGPFATLTAHRNISEIQLEARQVGVIVADEFVVDFDRKELIVETDRGTLPVRFSELVMEVDAAPRLPRALRKAQNVIPWPLERGELVENILNEKQPKRAVILGSGLAALELIHPLRERGIHVTWVRTTNSELDADIWTLLAQAIQAHCGDDLNVEDWTTIQPEEIVPQFATATLLDSVQDGRKTAGAGAVSGDMFFWTQPLRALHPILAQQGVEMDPSGLIAVDEQFKTGQEGLYLFGSAVAVPRGVDSGEQVLKGAVYSLAGSVAMGRGVADALCKQGLPWQGVSASAKMAFPGGVVLRAGLSMHEAAATGIDVEFAILKGSPSLSADAGKCSEGVVVKLLCNRLSRVVLGVQVIAPEHDFCADAIASAAAVALSARMSVDTLAALDLAGGAELLLQAAKMLVNKLECRVLGITPDELLASKDSGATFFMLDLRDQVAWKNGHIADAYNIPLTQLKERLQDEVPRMTPLVLIARTSDVAYNVACMLHGLGATSLYVLDGGMELWPYETETAS